MKTRSNYINIFLGIFMMFYFFISGSYQANALITYPNGTTFGTGVVMGSSFGSLSPIVGVALSTPELASTGSNLPITFGHIFRQGDVASGSTVTLSTSSGIISTQVDPKAYYSDGSLKHAIISTIAPVTTRSGAVYALLSTGATYGTAGSDGGNQTQSLASIFSGGYNVTLELTMSTGGLFHASSLEAYTMSGVNEKWLSGSIVNEWEVTMPLISSTGAKEPHLTARFVIRSYLGTPYIRTDVILENTWNFAPGITNETYDAVIKGRSGEELFRENGVNHFVFSRWREIVWDNSNNPNTDTIFDTSYLISTNAISNYDRNISMNLPLILQSINDFIGVDQVYYKLMGKGINTYIGMSAPGGRQDIGLEMGYTVDYLLTQDYSLKKLWLKGIDRAGAWPIHVRDIHSGGIHSIERYPYTWFDENGTCRNIGYQIDPVTSENQAFSFCTDAASPYTENTYKHATLYPETAHQPSYAFIPYIITGDSYYRDELKFWSNFNLLNEQEFYGRKKRKLFFNQVRGQAWSMRTLAQASWILPDSDPDKAYFKSNLDFNIQIYKDLLKEGGSTADLYNGPNTNYAGLLGEIPDGHPYATNGEPFTGTAPWMHDFVTSAFGFIYNLGYSEIHDPLLWNTRFVTGRLGSPDDQFCRLMASEYSIQTYSSGGVAYTTFKQAYDGTIGNLTFGSGGVLFKTLICGSQEMADARSIMGWGHTGVIQINQLSGYAGTSIGYAENMQPSIATAVDMSSTGAELGWSRFVSSAPNSRNSNAYGVSPEFSIWPRSKPQTYYANGKAILGFNIGSYEPSTGTTLPSTCTNGGVSGSQSGAITQSTTGLCQLGATVGNFLSTVVGSTTNYSWSCNGVSGSSCTASYTYVPPSTCTNGGVSGSQSGAITQSTTGLCQLGATVGNFLSTVVGSTTNYSWSCNGVSGSSCTASYTYIEPTLPSGGGGGGGGGGGVSRAYIAPKVITQTGIITYFKEFNNISNSLLSGNDFTNIDSKLNMTVLFKDYSSFLTSLFNFSSTGTGKTSTGIVVNDKLISLKNQTLLSTGTNNKLTQDINKIQKPKELDNIKITYFVSDKSILPGTILKIYRSDDGIIWSKNKLMSECKLDEKRSCNFDTDKISYFGLSSSNPTNKSGNTVIKSYNSVTNNTYYPTSIYGSSLYSGLVTNSDTEVVYHLVNYNPVFTKNNIIENESKIFKHILFIGKKKYYLVFDNNNLRILSDIEYSDLYKK